MQIVLLYRVLPIVIEIGTGMIASAGCPNDARLPSVSVVTAYLKEMIIRNAVYVYLKKTMGSEAAFLLVR